MATKCSSCGWDRGTPRSFCLHWYFPIGIFLASKQVNTLAKSIFFSQNTFLVWDSSRPPSRVTGAAARSEFVYLDLTLRRLRQMNLASIRWLEFRLESFKASENKENGTSYKLWHELAELISNTTLAKRLTLVIDFSFLNHEYACSEDGPEDTWQAYQNIADTFKHKERLFKDFFLHLASPGAHNYKNDILRWARERELEKVVMNDQDYNSALRGKYRQRWLDESSGPRMYFRHFLQNIDLGHLDDRDAELRKGMLDQSLMYEYWRHPESQYLICLDHN